MVFEYDFSHRSEIPAVTRNQIKLLASSSYADSTKMSTADWEEVRRGGLGGSDIAALTGDSPFNTNWSLFMDKTGIVKSDLSDNWFRLKYGHYNEPLVAELFARKFGVRIINETGMYRHPELDFVRANLDRLAILPSGELVILECKTSNPFARSAWESGVPVYYEWQGRQYLAVINAILMKADLPPIRLVYYSALYGNTEDEVIFRKVEWDPQVEAEMLALERDFWLNHVVPRKLPVFNGTGKKLKELCISCRLELAELAESLGQEPPVVDENTGDVVLGQPEQAVYEEILVRDAAIKNLKAQIKAIEEEVAGLEVEMVTALGGHDSGILPSGVRAVLSSRNSRSTDMDALKEMYPEAYERCVSEKTSKSSLSFKKPTNAARKARAAKGAAEVA